MKKSCLVIATLLSTLSLSQLSVAAGNIVNNVQYNSNQQYAEPASFRDPFTPSRLMYETVGMQSSGGAGAYGFVPNLQGVKIPKMRLRGFIKKNGKEGVALLEVIGSGTYMVREGDEINIDPSQPRQAIRISQITRTSVSVETGTLGTIRVLR